MGGNRVAFVYDAFEGRMCEIDIGKFEEIVPNVVFSGLYVESIWHARKYFSGLVRLRVVRWSVDGDVMRSLVRLRRIVYDNFVGGNVGVFASCKRLRHLKLSSSTTLDLSGVKNCVGLHKLALKCGDVDGVDELNEIGLRKLVIVGLGYYDGLGGVLVLRLSWLLNNVVFLDIDAIVR